MNINYFFRQIILNPTFYALVLFLFVFSSCDQKRTNRLEKDIIGEWIYVKEVNLNHKTELVPEPFFPNDIDGFSFMKNNVCENKLGYLKRVEGNEREDRKTFFIGTNTKYKIEGDVLKIYDLSISKWISQKIVSITPLSMTLQENDSIWSIYKRITYNLDTSEHYDQIIISASGCYGTCPINNISINKTGNVIYYGIGYNTVNGYFKSIISNSTFEKIESNFKKANIPKLKEMYMANWTDDETISVSFIKNNRIVKTISDYGRQSPSEFIWAYTTARYLYQQISLDSIKNNLNFSPLVFSVIESNGKISGLTQSEMFYLWTNLLNSKVSDENFSPLYAIKNMWNDKDIGVKTNGRYFQIIDSSGVKRTYDLGYNFITTNYFEKKLNSKVFYD